MPRLILASVSPDNTPHGYNWTFAFPMLLFIVIGVALYFLFSRPHRRVPGRRVAMTASTDVPAAEAARSAAIAAGLSTAPGGGTTESHLEGPGAHLTAAGHAQPAEIDPEEADPAEADPAETDPAETDPAETDPAEADPAETDPDEADPAETDPDEADRAETDPEASE